MPKGKIEGKNRKRINVVRKFKIGGRKSTRSALQMSTSELEEFVNGKSGRPKDRVKARKVLDQRRK